VATNGEQITVTCDGLANIVTAGTNDTIREIVDTLKACTNSSGTTSLTIDEDPSLAADSTDDDLLDGTYTAVAGKWLEVLWDTSQCKHYDLYLPNRSYQIGTAPYIIGNVSGVPGGTGNVTASIYKNRTLVKQQVFTSPVYVNPATWVIPYAAGTATVNSAYTNSFTADATVNVDWNVDLPCNGQDGIIVRFSRDTTGTTGLIGAVIK
jgi:hypothetical protein